MNKLCDIFDEVKRVLKKSGTCWVNMGDTYFGGGNNRGGNFDETLSDKQRTNRGTAYENATTNFNWGTYYPNKSLCMIPSRFAIEMSNRGWILRNEIIWHKPNCMPSSVKDRFTVDFEKVFFFVKNKRYWFETQYEPNTSTRRGGTNDSACKQGDYAMKTTGGIRSHRNDYNPLGRNKRCVWTITTKPFKEAHFATYPEALIEPMIKAGCPVGGLVLDPFMGAGTTALVAMKQNKNYIGIELNPEYVKIAEDRMRSTTPPLLVEEYLKKEAGE
jgi:site-specific DNA-methyltransferase (adenine-specific)